MISTLVKKLDRIFSEYIRLRDADGNGICRCITCGAPHHWTKIQNGHHFKRQKMNTRFDEVNNNSQCIKCNYFEQGNDAKYKEALIKKYGQEAYDMLSFRAGQSKKWTSFELETMIKHYTEKVKQFKNK